MVIDEVNARGHLVSLLEKGSITVHLIVDQEESYLVIDKGKLTLLNSVERVDAVIDCDEQVLRSLLFGEQRLREAIKNKSVRIRSTFRITLFLETLFKLSLPQLDDFAKKYRKKVLTI